MLTIVNPTTEEHSEYPESSEEGLRAALVGALHSAKLWRTLPVADRAAVLLPLAEALSVNREPLARQITIEMGKPLSQSRAELDRCIEGTQFFCARSAEWLASEKVPGGRVVFDPVGTAAVLTPWNFPLWLPLQAMLQVLLAGNTILWKPSELVPRSSAALKGLFDALPNFPSAALSLVQGGISQGKWVTTQPEIGMISFTGSREVGKELMAVAAKRLARVSLELGGLDAAVVLNDADIESAATQIVLNNAQNNGQVCIAVKRVYVDKKIYPAFVDAVGEISRSLELGDPLDETVQIGPLASISQLKRVERFVTDAHDRGGQIKTGGKRVERQGYFYAHTVLTDLAADTQLLQQEPFGPLLPIVPIDSPEEGILKANNTPFGLGASVWTKTQERAEVVMSQLDAGVVRWNAHGAGPIGAPFGGMKESGIGRLRWHDGMREFTQVKYIG